MHANINPIEVLYKYMQWNLFRNALPAVVLGQTTVSRKANTATCTIPQALPVQVNESLRAKRKISWCFLSWLCTNMDE